MWEDPLLTLWAPLTPVAASYLQVSSDLGVGVSL